MDWLSFKLKKEEPDTAEEKPRSGLGAVSLLSFFLI